MNRRRLFACVIAVCLAVPLSASAAEITLFEGPNFQGRSMTFSGEASNLDPITAVLTAAFLRCASCRGSPVIAARATPMQGITLVMGTVTDITEVTAEMAMTAATMAIPITTTVNDQSGLRDVCPVGDAARARRE